MQTKELTLIVDFPGDWNAGIASATWEIENIYVDDEEHREQIRKTFKEAFDCQTGGGHKIWFSDELGTVNGKVDHGDSMPPNAVLSGAATK